MISVDGKGTVFPVSLNYKGDSWHKDIKKENFKKDAMRQITILT